MTCHICNEEHALFETLIKDGDDYSVYLLCGNCYDMLTSQGTEVRT